MTRIALPAARRISFFLSTSFALTLTSSAFATVVTSGDVVGAPNVDDALIVGDTATGSLSVDGASTVSTPDGAQVGNQAGSEGVVTVKDAGSAWNLLNAAGGGGLLKIGLQGKGTLSIQNGGKVRVEDTSLSGMDDGVQIGGGLDSAQTGGNGAVNVTGTGSELIVRGDSGFINIGRRGGAGELKIEDHGRVEVQGAFRSSSINAGRGGSTGDITVDSGELVLKPDATNTESTSILIGREANSPGSLAVKNGGKVRIEGTSSGSHGMNIGRDTDAYGRVTVDGVGSEINTDGRDNYVNVGTWGEGHLTVSGMAGVDTGFMNIGRNTGSHGEATFVGTGTKLNIDASGNIPGFFPGGASVRVGHWGWGTLDVKDGAEVNIATEDLIEAGLHVGSGDTGTGVASIANGSSVSFTGDRPVIRIGSNGNGTLNVSGGSTITDALWMTIGASAIGSGLVNIDGPSTSLRLTGIAPGDATTFPASFLNVGLLGSGELNITNGASLSIDSGISLDPNVYPGINIGGSGSNFGGTGIVNVDGAGSEIRISNGSEHLAVGRNGFGTLNISNGAEVVLENVNGTAAGWVGRKDSMGHVTVSGFGSRLDAGSAFNIGYERDPNDGAGVIPGGVGQVNVSSGGVIQADIIRLATGSSLGGDGMIIGDVFSDGLIGPGNSPGDLTIDGDLDVDKGMIVLEYLGGVRDTLIVTGDLILSADSVFQIFTDMIEPLFNIEDFLDIGGAINIAHGFDLAKSVMVFATDALDVGRRVEVAFAGMRDAFVTKAVPEPGTFLLFGIGLVAIGFARKRAV